MKRGQPSNVVSERQFLGVRLQVVLLCQIGLIVFADIVVEQGDRHDQGQEAVAISIYKFQQLSLFGGRELGFEIAQDVLKDILVLGSGGGM